MRENSVNASFTVEATFIMPIVVFVQILLLSLILFYYDKIIVISVVNTELVNYSGIKYFDNVKVKKEFNYQQWIKKVLYQSNEMTYIEVKKEYIHSINSKLEKQMLCCSVDDINIDIEDQAIQITISIVGISKKVKNRIVMQTINTLDIPSEIRGHMKESYN